MSGYVFISTDLLYVINTCGILFSTLRSGSDSPIMAGTVKLGHCLVQVHCVEAVMLNLYLGGACCVPNVIICCVRVRPHVCVISRVSCVGFCESVM